MKPSPLLFTVLLASACRALAAGCLPLTVESVYHLTYIPAGYHILFPLILPVHYARVRFGSNAVIEIQTGERIALQSAADGQRCTAMFREGVTNSAYALTTRDGGQSLKLYRFRAEQAATVADNGSSPSWEITGAAAGSDRFRLSQLLYAGPLSAGAATYVKEDLLERTLESLDDGQTWRLQPGSFSWQEYHIDVSDKIVGRLSLNKQSAPPASFLKRFGKLQLFDAHITNNCFSVPLQRRWFRRADFRIGERPEDGLAPCPPTETKAP